MIQKEAPFFKMVVDFQGNAALYDALLDALLAKSDAPQPKIWQENLETVVKSRLTSRSELIVAARDGQVQDVRSF